VISRLKAIFPEDWQYVLGVYKGFLCCKSSQAVSEDLLFGLLETGVRFGERLARLPLDGFLEVGCGLAIPSLTLAKLGRKGGRAVDIDPKVLACAEDLRNHVGCDLEIGCRDIFKDRPKLNEGDLLIAEKPASYKKNVLEVEYTIANWCKIEGYNFATVPSYIDTDTRDSYAQRCAEYERKLRQVGFRVENRGICEPMPFRWLIANKW